MAKLFLIICLITFVSSCKSKIIDEHKLEQLTAIESEYLLEKLKQRKIDELANTISLNTKNQEYLMYYSSILENMYAHYGDLIDYEIVAKSYGINYSNTEVKTGILCNVKFQNTQNKLYFTYSLKDNKLLPIKISEVSVDFPETNIFKKIVGPYILAVINADHHWISEKIYEKGKTDITERIIKSAKKEGLNISDFKLFSHRVDAVKINDSYQQLLDLSYHYTWEGKYYKLKLWFLKIDNTYHLHNIATVFCPKIDCVAGSVIESVI
ncbi:hypothetical protein [Chondrinema litorale]|uniref:hypothetical protein n=1 Tax=Chondrinema litorale TaxID=2994555 RepID=UPI002542D52B|nr:hypothetical protein [Chondrinema litorale]UZR97002.1 hypothetical protein OQ292_23165 [Chondrinema litorale]